MKRVKNPFIVSGKIEPEYFCDRVEESARLIKSLTNGNNLVLISPRRMGKTGLVHFCYDKPEISDNYYTVFIDLLHTTSLREFTLLFGKSIFESIMPLGQKMLTTFVQTLKSLSGKFSVDLVTNMPTFNLELGDITHPALTLEEIFAYLEKADKPCIVAFDEFQQIANYPEKNIEALLRSHVQQASNANFIFAGSEYHIMQEMFMSSAKPFYNSADTLELKAIDLDEYIRFVQRLMGEGQREVSSAFIKAVYRLYRGNTYAMQKTFNELYSMLGEGEACTPDSLVTAINNVIDSKEALFREMLSGINDKHKPLLYAIAQDGEAERLTSAQFVKGHKLASASAVQYSAAQLLSKGVLTRLNGKYSVNDPFFALWINRMYGTKQLSQLIDYQEL
ncbi:MAG: ATP-binding protein [Muribaculaceae bacterium]|nr:ATP-binding protein [Muribaculaceae bacterium]MBQ7204320.1 ATP-binding protein [Muribaculaceae bacterium]